MPLSSRSAAILAGILVSLFALVVGEARGSAAVPDAGARARAASVTQANELEAPILAELNRVRRAHGLRPLKPSPRLALAADAHLRALALAGQFRHEWPDGRRFDLWIRRFYPIGSARFWAVGENLIWNGDALTPRQVVETWLASPPHRRVLLTPAWRELGIGAARAFGAGGVYAGADVVIAAAEFGARS